MFLVDFMILTFEAGPDRKRDVNVKINQLASAGQLLPPRPPMKGDVIMGAVQLGFHSLSVWPNDGEAQKRR